MARTNLQTEKLKPISLRYTMTIRTVSFAAFKLDMVGKEEEPWLVPLECRCHLLRGSPRPTKRNREVTRPRSTQTNKKDSVRHVRIEPHPTPVAATQPPPYNKAYVKTRT